MKKVLAIFCMITVLFGFTACGNGEGTNAASNDGKTAEADMSNYPESLEEWSAQNFIDYFTETGLFTDGGGYETWIQDHSTYWQGMPVSECAGWWDEAGTEACVMILILDGSLADTSEADFEEWKTQIQENKALPEDCGAIGVDHFVGNIAFCYSEMTLNDDILARIEEEYNTLIERMGVTPEF